MSQGSSVWVVDDDASIRWVLEKALQQTSIHTRVFDQAESALNQLRRETPDVQPAGGPPSTRSPAA